jgi:hypothetical protein
VFLEGVDLCDFLVVLLQDLFDVVLHFLDLLLVVIARVLLLVSLQHLHVPHLPTQLLHQLTQHFLLVRLVVQSAETAVEFFL